METWYIASHSKAIETLTRESSLVIYRQVTWLEASYSCRYTDNPFLKFIASQKMLHGHRINITFWTVENKPLNKLMAYVGFLSVLSGGMELRKLVLQGENGKSLMGNNAILDDLQFGCLLFSCEFYMRWRQTSVFVSVREYKFTNSLTSAKVGPLWLELQAYSLYHLSYSRNFSLLMNKPRTALQIYYSSHLFLEISKCLLNLLILNHSLSTDPLKWLLSGVWL